MTEINLQGSKSAELCDQRTTNSIIPEQKNKQDFMSNYEEEISMYGLRRLQLSLTEVFVSKDEIKQHESSLERLAISNQTSP